MDDKLINIGAEIDAEFLENAPLQRSKEWFLSRNGLFTSSENAVLMTIPKIGSFTSAAMTLIRTKLAERLTSFEEREETYCNAAMQWGIDQEEPARLRYEKETGIKVDIAPFIPLKGYEKYIGGSPDGLIIEDGKTVGIIEIKCPNTINHMESVLTHGIPKLSFKKYMVQMQSNMLCTGAKYCDFVSYDPRVLNVDKQIEIVRYPRDEKMIELIFSRLKLAIAELDKMIKELGGIQE